jgi:hypothetical protein
MKDLKKELQVLIKKEIKPLLEAQGFESQGQSFRRIVDKKIIQYLSVTGSRHNDPENFSFTLELSFMRWSPAAEADFWLDDPKAWILGTRFGDLTHGRDHWYSFTQDESSFEIVKMELRKHIDQYLLPAFSKCISEKAICEFEFKPSR